MPITPEFARKYFIMFGENPPGYMTAADSVKYGLKPRATAKSEATRNLYESGAITKTQKDSLDAGLKSVPEKPLNDEQKYDYLLARRKQEAANKILSGVQVTQPESMLVRQEFGFQEPKAIAPPDTFKVNAEARARRDEERTIAKNQQERELLTKKDNAVSMGQYRKEKEQLINNLFQFPSVALSPINGTDKDGNPLGISRLAINSAIDKINRGYERDKDAKKFTKEERELLNDDSVYEAIRSFIGSAPATKMNQPQLEVPWVQ